jgi:PhnB protein
MQVQPYLFFEGRADEAIEFYKKTLGAEVQMLMRYKDSPEPSNEACMPANSGNAVMHCAMRIGDTTVMASDGMVSGNAKFQGIALSLDPKTDDEAKRMFNALADGGQVVQALTKTFFASSFGMVTDRFGVMWMLVVMA